MAGELLSDLLHPVAPSHNFQDMILITWPSAACFRSVPSFEILTSIFTRVRGSRCCQGHQKNRRFPLILWRTSPAGA